MACKEKDVKDGFASEMLLTCCSRNGGDFYIKSRGLIHHVNVIQLGIRSPIETLDVVVYVCDSRAEPCLGGD